MTNWKTHLVKREDLTLTFILTEERLGELWDILESFSSDGTVSANTACSDNVSREFRNKHDLLNYPNVSERRITRLSFRSEESRVFSDFSVEVADTCDGRISQTNFKLEAKTDNEETLQNFSEKVKFVIRNAKPRYSLFVVTNPIWILLPTVFLVSFAYIWIRSLLWEEVPITPISVFFGMGCGFLFGSLTLKLWGKLFPAGRILLGREHEREKTLSWIRTVLGGGLLVTLLAAVIKALFIIL